MYSPVDTLRESRTERVGAGAFDDIDESTRIEDYLENPVSARSADALSPCKGGRSWEVSTYHGEVGEDRASLSATVDCSVVFFADGA